MSRNRNYRKDRRVIHCEWYNSTVADSAGKLVAVLSLVLDVTERKRVEEELRATNRAKDEFLGCSRTSCATRSLPSGTRSTSSTAPSPAVRRRGAPGRSPDAR